ncbi:MAG: DUF3053 domain-containing protein [Azoarcus sp.]|nr:DUF3053 domain-containing protein [Azoarcus sp.]
MNKHFRSIVILWAACFAFLLAVTGCSREPQERQAFISFLQKEVIPRNSALPLPIRTVRKKFGVYAPQYDIIVNYNKATIEKIVKPLDKLQLEYADAMKPESNVKERRDATLKYRQALLPIAEIHDKELAIAESQIAALSQPEDLQSAYLRAVEKHVRIPAKVLKTMIPSTIEMLDKNLELLDFITASKGKVEIRDGMIQVKDQSTLAKLNAMQGDISKMAHAIQIQHNELTRQSFGK